MNLIVQYGRLISKPELKIGKNGKEYTHFSVAVSKGYQGKVYTKDKQKNADFFNWVAFGGTALHLCDYGKRGDRVNILGHLSSSKYALGDGTTRYQTSLIADIIELSFSGGSSVARQTNDETLANFMNISKSDESGGYESDYSKVLDEIDDEETPFF